MKTKPQHRTRKLRIWVLGGVAMIGIVSGLIYILWANEPNQLESMTCKKFLSLSVNGQKGVVDKITSAGLNYSGLTESNWETVVKQCKSAGPSTRIGTWVWPIPGSGSSG